MSRSFNKPVGVSKGDYFDAVTERIRISASANDHQQVLSAAQPQPNDRGELNAFVPGLALRRAALKRATPSPTGGENRVGTVAEQFEAKSLERTANQRFPNADYPILYYKGRTLVTS